MPRHPPCALKNLTTQNSQKTLTYYRENHENQHHHTPKDVTASDPGSIISKKLLLYKDARVHYVVLKQQPHHTPSHQDTDHEPPPKSSHANQHRVAVGCVRETRNKTTPPTPKQERRNRCCLRTQQCAKHITTHATTNPYSSFPTIPEGIVVLEPGHQLPIISYFIDIPPLSNLPRNKRSRSKSLLLIPPTQPMRATSWHSVLLRKEVIQPHLPVRLPCYDLVPIASPTFDSSLPTRGLGHRLRVLPTFVT